MNGLPRARGTAHVVAAAAVVAGVLTVAPELGLAHKPITSPYTYNDDVFPILREHCGACHRPGGIAPMSLLTHGDTVPWGESIRLELLAGHMPPWSLESAPTRFQGTRRLSPREMDIVLTWATGGTPIGTPRSPFAPEPVASVWPLGAPDLHLRLPTEVVLDAQTSETTRDFVLPTGLTAPRWIRAVDLQPGTAAVVRSATVHVGAPRAAPAERGATEERLLAAWLPGEHPIALADGAGFELPAGADLIVRVRYKKTWQDERKEMRDRSSVALYFAPTPAAAVRAVRLAPSEQVFPGQGPFSFSRTLAEQLRALAIYPDDDLVGARVSVSAIELDGTRRELITFRPLAGWVRRYWFTAPVALPRGTRLEATVAPENAPPGLLLVAPSSQPVRAGLAAGLTLNVIPGR